MNHEFSYYLYFYEVATQKSISRAAKRLYISQPAISKSIAQLESMLDCTLFNRTSKGMEITAQGKELFDAVKQSFELLDLAKEKISLLNANEAKKVIIGSGDDLTSFLLLPWLNSYTSSNPLTVVKIEEMQSRAILTRVKTKEVDFGLSHINDNDPSLIFKRLFDLDYCFVIGSQYSYLYKSDRYCLKQLENYPIIVYPANSGKRHHIESYFASNNFSYTRSYEVANSNMMINFATSNIGIAIIPRPFVVKQLAQQTLFEIRVEEQIARDSVYLVYRSGSCLPEIANNLQSFINNRLGIS